VGATLAARKHGSSAPDVGTAAKRPKTSGGVPSSCMSSLASVHDRASSLAKPSGLAMDRPSSSSCSVHAEAGGSRSIPPLPPPGLPSLGTVRIDVPSPCSRPMVGRGVRWSLFIWLERGLLLRGGTTRRSNGHRRGHQDRNKARWCGRRLSSTGPSHAAPAEEGPCAYEVVTMARAALVPPLLQPCRSHPTSFADRFPSQNGEWGLLPSVPFILIWQIDG
jgi:hypothetical protein